MRMLLRIATDDAFGLLLEVGCSAKVTVEPPELAIPRENTESLDLLQDTLRLLRLWFMYGNSREIQVLWLGS